MQRTSHFNRFKFIYHRLHQSEMEFRSACRASQSFFDCTEEYKVTSSAKIFIGDLTTSEMSLVYRINSKGQRIDPCGTPDDTWHQYENWSLITTLWQRVVRKVWNHYNKAPVIPIASSLSNSLSRGTESKAFVKSINIQCVLRRQFSVLAQSCTADSKRETVDRLSQKPNWASGNTWCDCSSE